MAWRMIQDVAPHKCDPLPESGLIPVGTLAECDGCGARFRLASVSQYNETWKQWERVKHG